MLIYQTLAFTMEKFNDKLWKYGNGMKSLNYLMDNILYQILKIALNISLKKI